jgi:hypothetical protein
MERLLVAQGGHGIETAGAESGDVAGGAGDEGEGAGGETQCERIVWGEAEELALDDAGEREGGDDASGDADSDEDENFAHDQPDHVFAGGAEGHANANFAGALSDDVGHYAVEAEETKRWEKGLIGEGDKVPW